MDKMICPVLAQGWLGNKWSAKDKTEDMFKPDNLPKCVEKRCAWWCSNYSKCSMKKT